ncbi:MAG: fluoride efflux transporter CrcB [Granulosicoccaceae bacterium]|jgi:CrcB protein
MNQLFAIAAGGALGAVFRYGVSNGIYQWLGRDFPWGTLAVNTLGSLLMGGLYVLLVERLAATAELRAFLLIGVLGAFTTFSTFSIETLLLIENGQLLRAVMNMLASVLVCIAAAWVGIVVIRQL